MKEQTQSHNDDRTLSVAAVAVTVLGCMSGVAYVAWRYHRKTVDKTNQLRAAERKGRIRAEIRLYVLLLTYSLSGCISSHGFPSCC